MNFVFYCLTGRAFRSECRKLINSLWVFKDIQISCTSTTQYQHYHHHQQFVITERHRYISPTPQRINPVNRPVYL